ncbi:NAD(P)H-dependent glycerol-3-phosphate dehydrogenase [Maritimibacter sp. DP1N21-5]|uniref:NAD(P)H-dependent glycerol-3-phosphate dehydrogenase n=1 Tax=Maritimibacter sp. DP1N21-5 TaxID=2836867 RepID=UPI001C46BED6|nr:NAD(P)H-dependent glycerol-3-phosphate dehydrogenase [Maritimibacter sp. DP1N21-5]MBV7410961.1 NAD(P)-dependent glycerol-3-phosphate dehydrogenase [Maritimibacter sp. DP1N21-5]
MSVSILGAGAFGTSLAIAIARNGTPVTLWARDAGDMATRRENTRRLPSFPFPEGLTVTEDLTEGLADLVLLAVPMQQLRGFLAEHCDVLAGRTLIATCKGIDLTTHQGPAEIIAERCPTATPALLSGPSFAVDVAAGLPTALTIAAADPEPLQRRLNGGNLRLYRSTDLVGVETGGAMKNVIAIACGLAIGAGLGESARAALLTRGFAEMNRFAIWRGAEPDTLAGLSGFGDLALTSTSEKSRNYAFGLALGRGETPGSAGTVEGRATARAVSNAARDAGIEMPITDMVVAVIDGKLSITEASEMLLARPLKEE